ncbi:MULTISPECIES: hypothetical protein [unclassified Streptomyces]|uniref:hypothetical protein n=1 Tax=unclassified Streptomyces TaxID=2593676 RepID=UPI00344F809E
MERTADLLAIYLNDHLAGSAGGVELLRRAARAQPHEAVALQLRKLVDEVVQDRTALTQIMRELGIAPRRSRLLLGRLGEKAGRLKTNGRLLSRSPLSDVLELEAMRLGVEGKACCWRTLRALAETDRRLDPLRLEQLLRRAEEQAELLETLRMSAASDTFSDRVAS